MAVAALKNQLQVDLVVLLVDTEKAAVAASYESASFHLRDVALAVEGGDDSAIVELLPRAVPLGRVAERRVRQLPIAADKECRSKRKRRIVVGVDRHSHA